MTQPRTTPSRPARRALLLAPALLAACCAATAIASPSEPEVRHVAYGKDRYVALRDLASFYGMRLHSPLGNEVTLKSEWTELAFETDSRKISLNGLQVWMHTGPMKIRRHWSITETDMTTVIDPLLRPDVHLRDRGYRVVVLDPGHGGKDRGARGRRGVEEKRVVLDVVKRAQVHLANAGLKVYLTREGDRYLTLEERCRNAARWGADLFVSIHLNSSTTAGARGVETYVLTAPGYPSTNSKPTQPTDRTPQPGHRLPAASAILGYHLHRNLVARTGGQDRGLRRAGFFVLKNTACPAALIECGFVSNGADEEKFLEGNYRENIAQAVSRGVLDYIDAVKRARLAAP